MEDLETSTLLIILAGLVVAFMIWKRSKGGSAVGDAPQIPVTGAPPVVPVESPVSRGAPPIPEGSPPAYTATGRAAQPIGVVPVATGPSLVSRTGRGHF